MLIGLCLILTGSFLIVKKRCGALRLLLFILLLSLNFVCLPIYAELDAKEPKVIVTPSVLDFGHVRPIDSPVLLHFDINNRSSKQVVISDIVTGCGCTSVDFPKAPISPQKGTRASVKVNLLGRMGEFKSSILVKTNVGETVSLEVRGVIETDIWYNGQVIRATATKDQRVVTANLVLFTVKYPDVEFDETGFNDTVSAKIVSREKNQDGETKIVLAVDINLGENDMVSSNLELTPTDKNIAPLIIPVYCERNYDEQSVPQLITKQVSLGVLGKGQRKFFSVYGDPDILQVVRSVELKNAPSDFSFEILRDAENPQIDELKISVEVDQAQPGGVEGTLVLKTAGSREYPIPFFCEVKD